MSDIKHVVIGNKKFVFEKVESSLFINHGEDKLRALFGNLVGLKTRHQYKEEAPVYVEWDKLSDGTILRLAADRVATLMSNAALNGRGRNGQMTVQKKLYSGDFGKKGLRFSDEEKRHLECFRAMASLPADMSYTALEATFAKQTLEIRKKVHEEFDRREQAAKTAELKIVL